MSRLYTHTHTHTCTLTHLPKTIIIHLKWRPNCSTPENFACVQGNSSDHISFALRISIAWICLLLLTLSRNSVQNRDSRPILKFDFTPVRLYVDGRLLHELKTTRKTESFPSNDYHIQMSPVHDSRYILWCARNVLHFFFFWSKIFTA